MASKISVVVNTFNEEKNLEQAIKSVGFADEIIVCDMHSEDETVSIARKLGAKIFFHKKMEYVELVRNFAISKTSNDWILIIDPDEQIPKTLAKRLQDIASSMKQIDYVRIPRKNIIFGHVMKASGWWPDLNIRFFKRGKANWSDKIHTTPTVSGLGLDLPADEKFAIEHHSYQTVSEFLAKMDRYTTIQAGELKKEGKQFDFKDLFEKPLSEFLSRFFVSRGYNDGLHGLALSLLQAFSFVVVYLKLWEKNNFREQNIDLTQIIEQKEKSAESINYWIKASHGGNFIERFIKKIKG